MQDPLAETLRAWQNFYMLTGGAATSLLGLVFVAASFVASRVNPETAASGVRMFVTPTIIHFTAVLVIAALITIPTQTYASLGGLLGLGGVVGLGNAGGTGLQLWQHHQRHTSVIHRDWVWRVCLPILGYLLILGTAIGLLLRTTQVLNGLALAVIVFLLIGVRNAWDLVLWITRHRLPSG